MIIITDIKHNHTNIPINKCVYNNRKFKDKKIIHTLNVASCASGHEKDPGALSSAYDASAKRKPYQEIFLKLHYWF